MFFIESIGGSSFLVFPVIPRLPTRQSLRRSGYGSPAKAESRYGDGASGRRGICSANTEKYESKSLAALGMTGSILFANFQLSTLARIIHGHPAETRATLCANERCDRKPMIAAGNRSSATEIFRRDKEGRRRRCRGASQRSPDAVSAEKIGAAAGVDHE